jgi:hypothetical protein
MFRKKKPQRAMHVPLALPAAAIDGRRGVVERARGLRAGLRDVPQQPAARQGHQARAGLRRIPIRNKEAITKQSQQSQQSQQASKQSQSNHSKQASNHSKQVSNQSINQSINQSQVSN